MSLKSLKIFKNNKFFELTKKLKFQSFIGQARPTLKS